MSVTGISDGMGRICITNPTVAHQTLMEYWNGTTWVRASYLAVSGNDLCGDVPVSQLLGTIIVIGDRFAGDVNGDGHVDIVDLAMVGAAFGSTPSSPHWSEAADLNGDGAIDIVDLVIVASHFGQSV